MWIGVDLMHERELGALLERAWFRTYAYAPEELAVAESFGDRRAIEFLTGRFAGKEAVLKVLGTGVAAGVAPRHVVILRGESGAPLVRLSGPAAKRAADRGIAGISVSISHKKGMVFAAAVGAAA